MKSEEFFSKGDIYGSYFKGIQGIYVIQQSLFKKNGRDIYKIGFARDSLYKEYEIIRLPMALLNLILYAYGKFQKVLCVKDRYLLV